MWRHASRCLNPAAWLADISYEISCVAPAGPTVALLRKNDDNGNVLLAYTSLFCILYKLHFKLGLYLGWYDL